MRDAAAARAIAEPLANAAPPDARLCGLLARIAFAESKTDEARAWMTRGLAASQDPDWTDIDPAAVAFAYAPTDWARLVATYAETGELIHPRLERREKVMSELPELPHAYEPIPALATAPDDPGPESDWATAAPG